MDDRLTSESASRSEPLPLTIVIPTRDRPERLARCLRAVAALDPPPAEVIVVDSASERRDEVARAAEGADRLIRCDQPGASRARNAGWRAATTPLVGFVDDDIRVRPDWVSRARAPLAVPSVGFVTGSIVAGDEEPARSRRVFPVALTTEFPAGPFDKSRLTEFGASANLVVRRDLLEAVGGFDEMLGAGSRLRAAEDHDLYDRLLDHANGFHADDAIGEHEQWRERWPRIRLEHDYAYGTGVRITKLLRRDRRRGRQTIANELRITSRGLLEQSRALQPFGVVLHLMWFTGLLRGLVMGSTVRVGTDGHLAASARG